MQREQPGPSIFREYFAEQPFVDRFASNPDSAVDVIIPIIHTNELWRANLLSLYREIPIARLLIGDGGCIDDSIEVARQFPRVEVLDHRGFTSLGFSLRKLIEAVRTEWFIYVHSDVYLPRGWFDTMCKHQANYDWFGCPQQMTVLVEYRHVDHARPYAGSQMGRKAAFEGVSRIDDDFVYRQEDFVLAGIVTKAGFREGRIEDTFHYHQTTYRPSPWARTVKKVAIDVDISPAEDARACMTQAKGIVKYLDADEANAHVVRQNVARLVELGQITWPEFREWVARTNPAWEPYFREMAAKRSLGAIRQGLRRRLIRLIDSVLG